MLITSLALTAAMAAAPTQSAYTGIQPIAVASCALEPGTPDLSLPYGLPSLSGDALIAISFMNEAPATVGSVTFDVSDGRTTSQIVDKGTFSRGVAIDHSYDTPQFQNGANDLTCSVKSVAFADGSLWQAQ
jgi:hypothetical protein